MRILSPTTAILGLIPWNNAQQYPFGTAADSNDAVSVLSRPQIDTFIKNILAEWNTPGGVSIALVQRSNTSETGWNIETKGYGLAKSDGTEMTAQHQLCIGSNSKLFAVLATGLLVSNESLSPRISWNTKIRDIYPAWSLMDRTAMSEATIVDAMSHRTGLPRHDVMYSKFDTVETILGRIKHLKPSAEFRDVWQYNNIMYVLLQHIPTLVSPSNTSFARYVKQHIFEPLGLSATTYSYEVAKKGGFLAEGFGRDGMNRTADFFGKGIPRVLEYPVPVTDGGEDGNFISGAGGVIMSAHDVAIWLQTLLLEGRHPTTGKVVIPREVIRKAASGITVQPAPLVGTFPELSPVVYGGGQMSSSYRGYAMIEHGGSIPGYKTQIARFPHNDFGLAIFSNDDYYGSTFIEIIKFRLIDEILGLDPIDWNSRLKTQLVENYEAVQSRKLAAPPPDKRRKPSSPLEALSGRYYNGGYGELMLSLVSESSVGHTAFVAKWDKFWNSHLRLDHFDGNLFNVTQLAIRPIIEASSKPNETWTENTDEENIMTAEFVFNDEGKPTGFGITGNFWGGVVDTPTGSSVAEKAEVWYERT